MNGRVAVTQRALVAMLVAIFLAIGVAAAAGVVALKLLVETQNNRVAAIENLCLHDNANARHNIEFLQFDVRASPVLIAKARARFKQTPDCRAFAEQTVRPKPPETP